MLVQTFSFDYHSSFGLSEDTSQQPKRTWDTRLLPASNQKRSANKTPDTSQKGTPQLTNHQSRHLNLSKNSTHHKSDAKIQRRNSSAKRTSSNTNKIKQVTKTTCITTTWIERRTTQPSYRQPQTTTIRTTMNDPGVAKKED